MTSPARLFDCLAIDLAARLSRPSTAANAARWAGHESALAGIATGTDAVERCRVSGDPVASRAALAALVRWAGQDERAADAVLLAMVPALRVVAGELSRRWSADPAEIDQEVAAAGWAWVRRVAGRELAWPDRMIAGGARDEVRSRLRADARRRARCALVDQLPEPAGAPEPTPEADAADWLRDAVARGVVSTASARLVWATRVLGLRPVELAADRRAAKTLVMARRRAERALAAAQDRAAG